MVFVAEFHPPIISSEITTHFGLVGGQIVVARIFVRTSLAVVTEVDTVCTAVEFVLATSRDCGFRAGFIAVAATFAGTPTGVPTGVAGH